MSIDFDKLYEESVAETSSETEETEFSGIETILSSLEEEQVKKEESGLGALAEITGASSNKAAQGITNALNTLDKYSKLSAQGLTKATAGAGDLVEILPTLGAHLFKKMAGMETKPIRFGKISEMVDQSGFVEAETLPEQAVEFAAGFLSPAPTGLKMVDDLVGLGLKATGKGIAKAQPIVQPIRKSIIGKLEKVAAPAIEKSKLKRKIVEIHRVTDELGQLLSEKKKELGDFFEKATKKASEDFMKYEEITKEALSASTKSASKKARKLATSLNNVFIKSKDAINDLYTGIKSGEIGNRVATTERLDGVSLLAEAERESGGILSKFLKSKNLELVYENGDPIIRKATKKGSNVIPPSESLSVADMVDIVRDMDDEITRKIAGNATESKQGFRLLEVKNNMMDLMDDVSDGATSEVNRIFKDFAAIRQKLGSSLGMPMSGGVSSKLKDISEDTLTDKIKAVIKGKVSGGDLFEAAEKEYNNIIRLMDVAGETGADSLVKYSNTMKKQFDDIVNMATDGDAAIKELERYRKNVSPSKIGIPSKEIAKIENQLKQLMKTKDLYGVKISQLSDTLDEGSLLPMWIFTNTVSSMPFVGKALGSKLRGAAGLVTASKWAPAASKSALKFIGGLKNSLSSKINNGLSEKQVKVISRLLVQFENYVNQD